MSELLWPVTEKSDPEKYLRMIVDSSLNGIAVTDDQSNFEFVNESFLKMIDWPIEEIIGHSFMKILPEDMYELALKQWDEIRKGIVNVHKIKIKTKKGELKYLNGFHQCTEINGKWKIVSITQDITEKQKSEKELIKSSKQLKLLSYLIERTPGGNTRASILKYLIGRPSNANQLARALNKDYKSIRHHLDVLVKNGIIHMEKEKNSYAIYFLSDAMHEILRDFDPLL